MHHDFIQVDRAQVNQTPSSVTEWHFDNSGYYTYVMINGSVNQKAHTIERLEDAGIAVVTSGRSFRPSDDDNRYDWYIRLGRTAELPDDLERRLETLFAGATEVYTLKRSIDELNRELENAVARFQTEARRAEDLQAERDELETNFQSAERQLKSLKEKNARLEADNGALTSRASELAQQLDQLSEANRRELQSLSGRLGENESLRSHQVAELQKQLEQLNTERSEWSKYGEELDESLTHTKEELGRVVLELDNHKQIAQAEKEKLESECAKLQTRLERLATRSTTASGSDMETKVWLETLLPNVTLTDGSVSFLGYEVSSKRRVLTLLEKLNSNRKEVRADAVGSADGWFEMHFNTGEDDLGRLYFRDTGNSRVCVLLGHKTTQPEDLGELKAINREIIRYR